MLKAGVGFVAGVLLGAFLVGHIDSAAETPPAVAACPPQPAPPESAQTAPAVPAASVAAAPRAPAPEQQCQPAGRCPHCGQHLAIPEPNRLWPAEVPAIFAAETVAGAFANARRMCPKLFPPNARLDCSVFPCAMRFVFEGKLDDVPGMDDIEACPAIQAIGTLTGSASEEGGLTIVLLSQHVPKGPLQRFADTRPDVRQDDWRFVSRDELAAHCTAGSGDSCSALVRALHNEPEEAAAYARVGCDAGDGHACVLLARTTEDPEAKLDWLQVSCRSDYSYGCLEAARAACRLNVAECTTTGLQLAQRAVALTGARRDEAVSDWDAYREAQRVLAGVLCRRGDADAAAASAFAASCKPFQACDLDCAMADAALADLD